MNRCVLTTRSVSQASGMLMRLRTDGLRARNMPLLGFQPQRLEIEGTPPDWLIALTPAAIEFGWPQLNRAWQQQPSLAAVGPGTLERLRGLAGRAVLAPNRDGGGDALLAELPATLHGQRVALLGTEVLSPSLQQALRQRGASVIGLCSARSYSLKPSARRVACLLRRYDHLITSLMSERALRALEQLSPDCLSALKRQPVFVISERLAAHARQAQWQTVYVAPQATLDSLCQHIVAWHQQHLE